MTTRRFEGKRAIVTGGGSGIGRACALQLADEGAAVAVLDARPAAAQETVAELGAKGAKALALACDIREEAAVRAAVSRAADALGGLDTVVAAAGITFSGRTHELRLEDWELVLSVNATGTFLTLKHCIPHLVAAGGGAIATVGSVASLVAAGRAAAYDASKGAILQLTRFVAVEYAADGVRANCVCPGPVTTGLGANTVALYGSSGLSVAPATLRVNVPQGRYGEASEVAKVVAFLCSDDASYVTGIALAADGGYTAI